MKTRASKPLFCGLILACLAYGTVAAAATRSWMGWGNDGSGSKYHTDWSDQYAWALVDGTATPPVDDLTTDYVQFTGTSSWQAGRYAINLDVDYSLYGIVFGNHANTHLGQGGMTISSTNDSVWTIGAGGIQSYSDRTLTCSSPNGAGKDIIGVGVVLGTTSAQTFINVRSKGDLVFNSSINFNKMGNNNISINVGADGTLTTNGAIIGNSITGQAANSRIIKLGDGSWTINHDNRATLTALTGTGDLRLQAGTIYLTSNGALGSSRLTSTSSTGARSLIIGKEGVVVDSGVDIRFLPGANNAAHTLTIGGNNTSGVVAYENELRLSAANTSGAANSRATKIVAETGGTVIFRGVISNLASATENRKGSIEKIGGGTVIFEAANTYNDTDSADAVGTTVSEGALFFNNTTGSGAGTKDVKVKAGATSGGSGRISGNMIMESGAFLQVGYGSKGGFTIAKGLSLEGNLAIAWGGDIGSLAIGGVLDLGGNTLTFDLNGYSGDTFYLITWDSIVGNAMTDIVINNLDTNTYTINYAANGIQIAIPEPSTYAAIMAFGVLAFVAYRRRRK